MKSCFLFFFLLIFLGATAQDTLNYIDSSGSRQGHWVITEAMNTSPYSQHNPAYKPDTKIEEGNYIDSRKTGKWISYYPNGNKKEEVMYLKGRLNGPITTYYENGNKKEDGYWKGTHWTGEYRLYYDNDSLREYAYYDSLGRRDGKQVYYSLNGQLYLEQNYLHGKENGWTRRYESGRLLKETFYNNGIIDGEERIYDSNGKLTQVKLYRDGKYIGEDPLPQQ
jgi:antitoxin component YwqK of YwqJK toxin-antitoxin module